MINILITKEETISSKYKKKILKVDEDSFNLGVAMVWTCCQCHNFILVGHELLHWRFGIFLLHAVSKYKSYSVWRSQKSWARETSAYRRSSKGSPFPTCWLWEGRNPSFCWYVFFFFNCWLQLLSQSVFSFFESYSFLCFPDKLDRVNQLNREISQLCRE